MQEPEPREPREQQRAMEELLREGAPVDADPGSCPDASTLAAFPEGKLLPEEQESVEKHLTQCDRCFSLVNMLMEEESRLAVSAQGRLRGFPAWLTGRRGLAAAGLVLVVILAAAFWVVSGRGAGPGSDGSETDRQLLAEAHELKRARPTLFGDFTPLTRSERLSVEPPRERGSRIELIHPKWTILRTRPAFRWHAAAGVTAIRIQLLSDEMVTVWERSADSSPFPYPEEATPLSPGTTNLWRVHYTTPFSESERVIQEFRVASMAERRDFEAAFTAIDSATSDVLANLIKAHYAIRRGLLGAAEAAARAHLRAHPRSKVGKETLRYVLVKQGSPEAAETKLEPSGNDVSDKARHK